MTNIYLFIEKKNEKQNQIRSGHIRLTIATAVALLTFAHQNFSMVHRHTYSHRWPTIRFIACIGTP